MIYDSHIHLTETTDDIATFMENLKAADVSGITLLSNPPASVSAGMTSLEPTARLKRLMTWAESPALSGIKVWAFYWIDPMDDDIFDQIDAAIAAGAVGFKCLCTWYYPCDEKPMQVWRYLAEKNLPVKFHSGILYSACYGRTDTSKYNRPLEFEALIGVPGLRFTLAHVSWPWCDECLALYGKARSMLQYGLSTARMYIETSPGTPDIYREEVLTKLYRIGYENDNNIIYGSDCREIYRSEYARAIVRKDDAIFDKLGLSAEQRQKYYCDNMAAFNDG